MAEEYDDPWKEAIERFLRECLKLMFSRVHRLIDWSKKFEFLKTDLPQPDAGGRIADILVKVWLKNGKQELLYIHLEVQAQYEKYFAQRVLIYWTRIAEKYKTAPISLVILIDDRPNWRPNRLDVSKAGFKLSFKFPTVKLLDFESRREELMRSKNVFSGLILAQLDTMATRGDDEARAVRKLALMKAMARRKMPGELIRDILKFVDWLMKVPPDVFRPYYNEYKRFIQENAMPYESSFKVFEREDAVNEGLEKGRLQECRENVAQLIRRRFGEVGASCLIAIESSEDLPTLNRVFNVAIDARSIEEVRQALK